MAAQYPEELTCDMAETYHVLDWRALGLPLAATLAAGLRENSRTRMALAGAKVPTETLLLGQAADALQLLLWTKTKDAQHGRNRPAPLAAFKQALLAEGGYKRLEDTLHPDEYRLAYLAGPLEPETIPYNRAGTFALDFGCKPQRFLKSGEDVLTVVSGGKLYNPTGCAALPLIRLTLTGDAKLNVGGVQMSVAGHTGPMWIDCDLQDAYYNNTNLNKYLTAPEFPVLGAGATQVSWSGGIDKCEVVPRWWRL